MAEIFIDVFNMALDAAIEITRMFLSNKKYT